MVNEHLKKLGRITRNKKKKLFHNEVEKNQSKVMWKFSQETHDCVWDMIIAKDLPDEIDVIVEASTETPGGHLV